MMILYDFPVEGRRMQRIRREDWINALKHKIQTKTFFLNFYCFFVQVHDKSSFIYMLLQFAKQSRNQD